MPSSTSTPSGMDMAAGTGSMFVGDVGSGSGSELGVSSGSGSMECKWHRLSSSTSPTVKEETLCKSTSSTKS